MFMLSLNRLLPWVPPMNLKRTPDTAELTQLLTDWRSGAPQALERLTPLVYDELRRLARGYMRGERSEHTLQATAVVHEAFMRLIQTNVSVQDRAHLFAIASRMMRRVLVDHAKSKKRGKRDGGIREALGENLQSGILKNDFDIVMLDDALESLSQMEPRIAEVIEMHYFGGLTYEQIAIALGISAATVHRDIRLGRAWLLDDIAGHHGA